MSWSHDKNSKREDLIRDISSKHTPDSVRQSAYNELKERGTSKDNAQREADYKYGDYWG